MFIATPHRGSFVAGWRIVANVVRKLVSLPFALTGVAPLSGMARRLHDQLGLDPVDVSARVLHDAVVALLDRALPWTAMIEWAVDGGPDVGGLFPDIGATVSPMARSRLTPLGMVLGYGPRDCTGYTRPQGTEPLVAHW